MVVVCCRQEPAVVFSSRLRALAIPFLCTEWVVWNRDVEMALVRQTSQEFWSDVVILCAVWTPQRERIAVLRGLRKSVLPPGPQFCWNLQLALRVQSHQRRSPFCHQKFSPSFLAHRIWMQINTGMTRKKWCALISTKFEFQKKFLANQILGKLSKFENPRIKSSWQALFRNCAWVLFAQIFLYCWQGFGHLVFCGSRSAPCWSYTGVRIVWFMELGNSLARCGRWM